MDWTAAENDGPRLAKLRAIIAELRPDVVSVQEIMADDPDAQIRIFTELAAALGMDCHIPDVHGNLEPAIEPGRRVRGVGLMWNPDRVTPVAGSLRRYNLDPFYIGMVLAKFDIDCGNGVTVRVACASTHLSPRCQYQRRDEATYVGTEVFNAGECALVGMDCNSPMGSRIPGSDRFYDSDPYRNLLWGSTGEMIPRCHRERHRPLWRRALGLPVRHWADREPMMRLEDAGLIDPAAWIGAPWYRTTGYWDQKSVIKRNDGPFVTRRVADAAIAIWSLDTEMARALSDHLPVVLDLCLDVLHRSADTVPCQRARWQHPRWRSLLSPLHTIILAIASSAPPSARPPRTVRRAAGTRRSR